MKLYEPDVKTQKATFGIQCFWGSESRFGAVPGVVRTRVGYTGGSIPNPNYENLADHTEVVEVQYDPEVTTYEKLLHIFWESHDPTVQEKRQYISAIFYHDDEQKKLAEITMKEAQKKLSKPIVTEILPAKEFYNAEDYHQKYILQKHRQLCDSLELHGKDLIHSHVAARLNGYVSGKGSLEAFENEWKKLGITEEQAAMCRKEMLNLSKPKCAC